MVTAVQRDQLGPAEVFHHLFQQGLIVAVSIRNAGRDRSALVDLKGTQTAQPADQPVAVANPAHVDRMHQPLSGDDSRQGNGVVMVIVSRPFTGHVDLRNRDIEDRQVSHGNIH